MNVDTLVERLGRVLVQYERAMIELGWTIADVRYKETLFDLAVRARRVAELEAALREVERYFGSELPPAGFPLGAVRAALTGDGSGA